ncbi:hypothetical protein L596_013610 [Steinernema carpocapsae]|uniref:aldehyde dehydrogenase (NAD(+)) n=1 Tax=Steinernema carpocapsae TaxID=34508 RepID=A0A4U5P0P1_STECR|nr:hypothetical protein L596_013610 [Steinernema carpocapsae]
MLKALNPLRTAVRAYGVPAPNRVWEAATGVQHTDLFINNEFRKSKSGKKFETFNPATGEKICDLAEGQKEDVDIAVDAATKAFKTGSPWRRMDAFQRGVLLNRLADLMERDRVILASLESVDNGKPYKVSYTVDVPASIATMRYYAGWADARRSPWQATSSHTPATSPWELWARLSPGTSLCLCRRGSWRKHRRHEDRGTDAAFRSSCGIADQRGHFDAAQLNREQTDPGFACLAGFPEGVVNIISGFGPTAGQAISSHMGIDKVAFTGSTEVGRKVMTAASESNLKRITLELGGKSPNIIFNDADMELAVQQAHNGIFFNHGQCCCAGSRTFVEAKIYDEFIDRSKEMAQKRVVGDPFDLKTDQGPQIDQEQLKKILQYIELGKRQGAQLVTGGRRRGDQGYFVEPTIFANVDDQMKIAQEEIFGPVMSVIRFEGMEDLVEKANNTIYGLAAAVVTKDVDKALHVANNIRAGTVWVNCYNVFDPAAPFGGYKMSGIGRELGEYGLQAYTEVKTVTIKVPQKNS